MIMLIKLNSTLRNLRFITNDQLKFLQHLHNDTKTGDLKNLLEINVKTARGQRTVLRNEEHFLSRDNKTILN